MILFLFQIIFLGPAIVPNVATAAFTDSGLRSIFTFFGADNNKTEELGLSIGNCTYDLLSIVRNRDVCAPDDRFILHLLPPSSVEDYRKPPIIKVKCLQPEFLVNVSMYDKSVLIMESVYDIVTLLKPIGNATKRSEAGNCVLILFYSPTCLGCARAAPDAHKLARQFQTLQIAAIDAFRFPGFNPEFGIVGLPTLLLFHQGRPIIKFYSDARTFAAFVTKHTGIQPTDLSTLPPDLLATSGPLPMVPVEKPDYILLLAWVFILLCLGKYFAKSPLCQQIIEMVKRNWRESEAQLEHN